MPWMFYRVSSRGFSDPDLSHQHVYALVLTMYNKFMLRMQKLEIRKHHQNQKSRRFERQLSIQSPPSGKKLDEYLRVAEDEVQSFQASLEENC